MSNIDTCRTTHTPSIGRYNATMAMDLDMEAKCADLICNRYGRNYSCDVQALNKIKIWITFKK